MNSTVHLLKTATLTATLVLGAALVRPAVLAQEPPRDRHWVGTWTTPPVALATTGDNSVGFNNQTLRQIAHISLGGSEFRVRLSNTFGTKEVTIGAAHIALRDKGAAIKPGSDRTLTFDGAKSITLWPGAPMVSDPVKLDIPALSDLALSIYLPANVPASLPITGHGARQTNYISPPGDYTAAVDMPVGTTKPSWFFLTSIEVAAPRQSGGVVTFGDSLTDGTISTMDMNRRWPDVLAARLNSGGMKMGVMNQGTGGSRLLHRGNSDSGLQRFDRDVLALPGVTHIIVFLGINDLRFVSGDLAAARGRPRDPTEEKWPPPEDMIAGYKQLILRARAKGIKIYGATLLPWENETFVAGAFTPEGAAKHRAINEWIRSSGAFDGVIDFYKILQDPSHPTRMLPEWDSGDALHPGDAGYRHMGESIDLALFK